jgi:hypothetical protein
VGEVVAMPIRSSFNQGVFFEPEMIAVMGEALEAACKVSHDADQPEAMREIIARRIIAAARFGERDPVRLRAAALAVGWKRLTVPPPGSASAHNNQASSTL